MMDKRKSFYQLQRL